MTLTLYNTLTRRKEIFTPIDSENVGMYVCGVTVYDLAHIGNARPTIVFDVLFRLLRHLYGADHVTYVRNITDVDDKINARAAREGISIRELTERTTKQLHADFAELGTLEPTFEPRATEFVARDNDKTDMIGMIETLIANGHAYEADGHVLFDVSSMPDYGKLSGRSVDDMIAGARVDVAPYKKGPMDFVLWKPSAEGTPGWDSPWGWGRPGWHIECSAMSAAYLGKTFDIHGGGIDLTFPHHENEIAQSRCCFGTERMANVWMHNGFLQVEGDKMSKSEGNMINIRTLLDQGWPGEVLRLNMLRTQYRQPIDWTEHGLEESRKTLDHWYRAIGDVAPGEPSEAFLAAMLDDMNTPKAIAELHALRNRPEAAATLKASANLLGLLERTEAEWVAAGREATGIDAAEVERLIAARVTARAEKNFAEADRLRDELVAMGIVLMDGPAGTAWEVRR